VLHFQEVFSVASKASVVAHTTGAALMEPLYCMASMVLLGFFATVCHLAARSTKTPLAMPRQTIRWRPMRKPTRPMQ
jgi:hypothetical protein